MMALLDESGGVASAEVKGLNALALDFFQRAYRQDQHTMRCSQDLDYYHAWQVDIKGDHHNAADMYREAVVRNKSDWRALGQLVKLYLKVGLPTAALHHCELYHAALTKSDDLAEEDLLSRLVEVNTQVGRGQHTGRDCKARHRNPALAIQGWLSSSCPC
jgi:hypothetical protein